MDDQRHIAWFDRHAPHGVPIEPSLAYALKRKPTHFIIGGDFANLEFASHWNEAVFADYGWDKLRELLCKELEICKSELHMIRQAVGDKCKVIYIPGNHEDWLSYVAQYHPKLGVLSRIDVKGTHFKSEIADKRNRALKTILEGAFETSKYGVEVLPYNHELNLGPLTYVHGHQLPNGAGSLKMFPTKRMVSGHRHTHEVHTAYNGGDYSNGIEHVSVPTMGRLNPWFLRNRSNQWSNGFWEADILSTGQYEGRVKKVIGSSGKLVAP